MPSGGIHQEQLKVGKSELIGGEDDVRAGGMEIGCPGHAVKIGEPFHAGAVGAHRVDIGFAAIGCEVPPDDVLPIRCKERTAVVTRPVCQPLLV